MIPVEFQRRSTVGPKHSVQSIRKIHAFAELNGCQCLMRILLFISGVFDFVNKMPRVKDTATEMTMMGTATIRTHFSEHLQEKAPFNPINNYWEKLRLLVRLRIRLTAMMIRRHTPLI